MSRTELAAWIVGATLVVVISLISDDDTATSATSPISASLQSQETSVSFEKPTRKASVPTETNSRPDSTDSASPQIEEHLSHRHYIGI